MPHVPDSALTLSDTSAAGLHQAFDHFNKVSAELTQAYAILQKRVDSLTEELAVANGELRQQYQEKQRLSERLRLLLDALPAGVVALDGKAHVTEVNPAAQNLLDDHLEGRHWGDVVRQYLEPALAPGEWQLGERRLSLAESSLDSSGGKLLLLHDISAAHQMKAELERKQRLAAMGEMAASLAHQLRTPLATALLYAGNLEQPGLTEAARVRFAGKAATQLRRLERLIQDVLLFARGESIGRETIVLSELLSEVAQTLGPLSKERGIRLELEDHCPGMTLVGGKKPLFSALISLTENALQISGEKTGIRIGLEKGQDEILITVTDAGPGIPPNLQTRIFEPFFTTQPHGTGLGLPIALGVARAHGGNLEVLSPAHPDGTGACFTLRLPIQSDMGEN